jgi:biopolymer transport protein TolQ
MTYLFCFALFLFQADPDAAAGAPPPLPHQGFAVLQMVEHSGLIAQTVLLVLLCASLFTWAIILGKLSTFKKARGQSTRFLRAFRKAQRLQEIATVSEQFKPSPLVSVFDEVYETYRRQTGGSGPPRNITALERSAQNRLTWLATIGSIAPCIGLFGTVMGIVDAFQGLGTEGSATLRAVAPGVSAALITTAAGLLVAVPAVIAYNQFTARIRDFGARNDDFSRELLNSLEEVQLRPGQDPRQGQAEYSEREPARGIHS